MRSLPFKKPGQFFRGNLHLHSDNSDGKLALEDVIDLYRRNGYDFVSVTDHFREVFGFPVTDASRYRDQEFTTLHGAELHVPALENGEIWHILAVGLPLDFAPPGPNESGPDIARRAFESGAFVGVAHPAWYGANENDIRSLDVAHGIEVYNESCYIDNDRGDSWYVADRLLEQGQRYTAFATDDAHFRDTHPDFFGGWVMVKAERLDPEAAHPERVARLDRAVDAAEQHLALPGDLGELGTVACLDLDVALVAHHGAGGGRGEQQGDRHGAH
jgi:hypothetical protein